ncbi:MAG: T9SS type A sorting domain-containing protein, partial [Bacteroidales bacterium]|nr:T9SS type A sorting domain-containing protein [Bacteroidales bacterium]
IASSTYSFPVNCASIAELLTLENGTVATITGEVIEVSVNPTYGTVTYLVIKDSNDAQLKIYGVWRVTSTVYTVGQKLKMTALRAEHEGNPQMSFSSNSGHTIEVVTATDISTTVKAQLNVGPNPFDYELIIDSATDIKTVRLFNTAGQVVKSITAFNGQIETADVPAGLYILQVEFTDGTSTTQKVIKK